ncbi:hypothetical protein WJX73_007350 [Symbiochloris irregularis]|uniref:MOSC domain-containing protein n=1 Tax=Symbiochloris irregularis TaxID=706552 RepID=A0AAW1NQT7_9CHLO
MADSSATNPFVWLAPLIALVYLARRQIWAVLKWLHTPRHAVRPPVQAGEVSELVIYPVKACKGISVKRARIGPTGFDFDRHWVVVTEDERGRFKTQRNEPKLALVQTSLPGHAFTGNTAITPSDFLELRAPGREPLKVPLLPDPAAEKNLRSVSVWEWDGKGRDEGETAAQWLSEYLGKRCRLLGYSGKGEKWGNPTRRPTATEFAEGYEVGFADGFPFLLATRESLDDLNTRLKQQLPMNRFRPNIIVNDCKGAWQEDFWAGFQIMSPRSHKGVPFRSVKPCSRCKVTTTDQSTGVASPEREPLTTLGSFRSGETLGWTEPKDFAKEVFFGWNLVCEQGSAMLLVGDLIMVDNWRQQEGRTPAQKKTD